jgi:hypothetical protein
MFPSYHKGLQINPLPKKFSTKSLRRTFLFKLCINSDDLTDITEENIFAVPYHKIQEAVCIIFRIFVQIPHTLPSESLIFPDNSGMVFFSTVCSQ